MKSITEIAREAGLGVFKHGTIDGSLDELQRFATLVIEQEHKRLLEGSGGHAAYRQWNSEEGYWYYGAPACAEKDDELLYTADQMAAAVLRERERCVVEVDKVLGKNQITEAIRGVQWNRSQ